MFGRWLHGGLRMPWNCRDLNLIYVNDVPDDTERYEDFLTIKVITGLHSASVLLLRERNKDVFQPMDLLFCDVNFEKSATQHSGDVLWSVDPRATPIAGYGPLLALPFISATPWSMLIPFSNYWTESNVRSNGYILLSLALMLTLTTGRPQSTRDALAQIDEWKQSGEINFETFLRQFLPKLRERIRTLSTGNNQRVRICGVDATIQALEMWKLLAEKEGFSSRRVPFEFNGQPICVEIIDVSDRANEKLHLINVSSLFADLLDFQKPRDCTPIDRIIGELKSVWKKCNSGSPIRSLYDIASTLLLNYMPEVPGEEKKKATHWGNDWKVAEGSPLKRLIVEVFLVREGSAEFYSVVRLAMLLAWVRAWYVRATQMPNCDLQQLVYQFLGSTRLSTPSRDYVRLLGANGGKSVGTGPHRHAFRTVQGDSNKVDVLAAYCLSSEDESIELTPEERAQCRYFVLQGDVRCKEEQEEGEKFATDKVVWPRWMR